MNGDFGEKGICFGGAVMVNRHGFQGERYLFWFSVMVSGGFRVEEDGLLLPCSVTTTDE